MTVTETEHKKIRFLIFDFFVEVSYHVSSKESMGVPERLIACAVSPDVDTFMYRK